MTTLRNTFRRLRREETGVAIIVAMSVLLITGMLAAVVLSASSNVAVSTKKDTK
jgi:hypothetical protein